MENHYLRASKAARKEEEEEEEKSMSPSMNRARSLDDLLSSNSPVMVELTQNKNSKYSRMVIVASNCALDKDDDDDDDVNPACVPGDCALPDEDSAVPACVTGDCALDNTSVDVLQPSATTSLDYEGGFLQLSVPEDDLAEESGSTSPSAQQELEGGVLLQCWLCLNEV